MIFKYWTSIFLLAFSLAACSGTDDASIELSGLNYTDIDVSTFSVNGYYGFDIPPNDGGGGFVCCVTIPRKWHAGMKVTVRWTEDERVPSSWKVQVLNVPRYEKRDIGMFVVHFYPNDVVKVLVTTKMAGHPEYPYPRPE